MVRSDKSFPEAMLVLQNAIKQQGYTLSRVQRVDIGLTASGFQTDKYRIVFFGKPDEIRTLTAEHPQLIPYLPVSITIFAENEQTVLTAINPKRLYEIAPDSDFALRTTHWYNDIQSIMDDLRRQDD